MRTDRPRVHCIITKNGDFVTKRVWLDSAYDWLASKSEPDQYAAIFSWDGDRLHITGGEFLAMFRQARTTELPPCNCYQAPYVPWYLWQHEAHCQRRLASGL